MDCQSKSGHIEGIRQALERYVGKSARIVWDAGEVLTIVSVDGDGFVYE